MNEKKIWQVTDLKNVDLSDQDLEFLCNEGLEVGTFGSIVIYSEFESKVNCVVLGFDSDVPICCFKNGEGVFSIEGEYKRFVNSTAKAFSMTVARFAKYCNEVVDVNTEEEALAIVDSAINDMKNIDSGAWMKDINYWPIIGQQMLEGNL